MTRRVQSWKPRRVGKKTSSTLQPRRLWLDSLKKYCQRLKSPKKLLICSFFWPGVPWSKKAQTSRVWCLDYSFFIVAMTDWRQKMQSGEGMSLYPFTTTERTDFVTWFSLKKGDVLCSVVHMCRLLVNNLIRISQRQVDMAVKAKIRKYTCQVEIPSVQSRCKQPQCSTENRTGH